MPYGSLREVPYRPFCSQRCQQIDLGRWLNEEYRISEEWPELSRPDREEPGESDEPAEDG